MENYAVLPTQRDKWPELQQIEALRSVEMENDHDLFRPWEEPAEKISAEEISIVPWDNFILYHQNVIQKIYEDSDIIVFLILTKTCRFHFNLDMIVWNVWVTLNDVHKGPYYICDKNKWFLKGNP